MNKQVGIDAIEHKGASLVPFPAAGQSPPAPATQKKAFKAKRWAVGAIVAALILIAAGALWWSLASGSSVRYTTAPVTVGAITRSVTATGTVNPELTVIVGTYVSGVIRELSCDYNTQVKRGQVCAKIDPRPYQSIVDQAKANLAVANAQLEKDQASLTYAKLALGRAVILLPSKNVSVDAYDNATNMHEQALAQITFDEATIRQHQAVLDAAQVNLDYTNIVSPVDGTVVSRNVTMGQTVAASFQTPTLFLIASDLTKMEVDANVSESDIGGIKQANKATFTVDAYPKRIFEGVVTQVRQSPQTVQNVVTYDIVIGVDNADLALKPGLTAATTIVTDQRGNVLRVPNQALRFAPTGTTNRDSDRAHVWVLRDGKPVSVQLVTGLDDDNYTEIVQGGLTPADVVIVAEQRDPTSGAASVPRPRL
jgi:HlyD family secretion protein